MKTTKYKILEIDPYLESHAADIELRMNRYNGIKTELLGENGSFKDFANGHLYYGFHRLDDGWVYREWAPNAQGLALIGDFNDWNDRSHVLTKLENGNWEIFIPGKDAIRHGSNIKIRVSANGILFDRIPLYMKRVVQDPENHVFCGQIWQPENDFLWTDENFSPENVHPLLIYEAHVGMATEEARVGTYDEFTQNVLPRIKKQGYHTMQLMAIMEHPYYGSFGYQVSNFFAASSRFGTPDALKNLINTAHSMGIAVLLDIVHSHAVKNTAEGINEFDGTDYQFFHSGPRGEHSAWGTKLFNYGKHEVMHFLLSNIKFWLDEYHFDGFRFDGVTSMLYHDHALGTSFDHYDKYFNMNTDVEAITYLQFASELTKEVKKGAIMIAEDMSGMPGMCLPIEAGGIGFDYRLAMGMPDFWIKTISKSRDEDWNLSHLWHEMTQRRPMEKAIGYCESHDQALVGDKTIIFWLADQEMYWGMEKSSNNYVVDRAVALHKMIRLITCSVAGEGYLNFMGNEFGHPEWVDFPREGNGWSYKYARRQWHLADDENLRYQYLLDFDRAMLALMK
ncbi:MAG: 1,4-alpha-glucan-branching enzyme, partial [Clostridiales bacterium]|nr:1,4-alpha-glucan-branching enzyme [Clostridiales bacterium]